MKNLGDVFKQAQELQSKLQDLQTQLEVLEVEGQAGGGMVRVVMNGKGVLRRITIDPSLLNTNDKEVLEDLILAAHNDAKAKSEAAAQEEAQKLTGGMGLPAGMNLPI